MGTHDPLKSISCAAAGKVVPESSRTVERMRLSVLIIIAPVLDARLPIGA
jgi:hypothetical protein